MLNKPEIQSLLVQNRSKINELLMDLQHLKAKPKYFFTLKSDNLIKEFKKERFKTIVKTREKLKRLEFIQKSLKKELSE